MLARLLGINEDEAAARLTKNVGISCGSGAAAILAQELSDQLCRTINVVADGKPCDIEVAIGVPPRGRAPKRVFVTIDGEAATISKRPPATPISQDVHRLQIAIAACYAAGAVLRELIPGVGDGPTADPFLVRFDELGATSAILRESIELEESALVGGGAVGNGFIRAARHLRLHGHLAVVDPKNIGGGNPNRCLYFDENDVGKPKAEVLCAKAQADFPNLLMQPVVATFAEHVRACGRIRRAFVAADSRRARRSIQTELPLQVFDASTTDASEIIVHSHVQPNAGACLACIYRHVPQEFARERDIAVGLGVDLQDVISGALIDERIAEKIASKHPSIVAAEITGMAFDSLFKQLCSEQALLSPTGAQVFAPFAFVSNLAGALLALEFARAYRLDRIARRSNYFFLSPWSPPRARLRIYRPREPDCEFCAKSRTQQAFASVWPEYFRAAG